MHSHANGVFTLDDTLNNKMPNVAKSMRMGGYQTAMIGKWHLGEGEDHQPTGFDYYSVVPGQGDYWDPIFIDNGNETQYEGYAVDIVTDKAITWLEQRNESQPFVPNTTFPQMHSGADFPQLLPHVPSKGTAQELGVAPKISGSLHGSHQAARHVHGRLQEPGQRRISSRDARC